MREQNEFAVDTIAADQDIHPSHSGERTRANILGVGIDAVDMHGALATIRRHLLRNRKGYVCAVSVHGILESLRCHELAVTYAESTINVPDGTPTVWVGRFQGFRQMDHVTGPALMQEVFRNAEFSSCSHFFYGGKPGVAQELAARMSQQYPWTRIAGTYTPPFRDLNEQEERDLAAQINALQPDIVWVGIGTPRQELWMHRMLPQLDTRLMFGVGAAFDFHTGADSRESTMDQARRISLAPSLASGPETSVAAQRVQHRVPLAHCHAAHRRATVPDASTVR